MHLPIHYHVRTESRGYLILQEVRYRFMAGPVSSVNPNPLTEGQAIHGVDGLVPVVPDRAAHREVLQPPSAPSPKPTNTALPLHEAIVKGFESSSFEKALVAQLQVRQDAGVRMLWSAVEKILESEFSNRGEIAFSVADAIAMFYKESTAKKPIAPSPRIVGLFCKLGPGSDEKLLYALSIKIKVWPSELIAAPEYLSVLGAKIFLKFLDRNYKKLVCDPANHEWLAALCQQLAMLNEPVGLRVCVWLKDKYEGARRKMKSEAAGQEAEFLWQTRDVITAQLMGSSPCVRNFKLALLYPNYVPHPCHDQPVEPILPEEQWLVKEYNLLRGAFGEQVGWLRDSGVPRSDSFAPTTSHRDVEPREQASSSINRYHPLAYLYSFVGLSPETGARVSLSPLDAPRSWVSHADEERFRESCMRSVLRQLACNLEDSNGAPALVAEATAFLRNIVREYPYILAEAVRSCRGLPPRFINLLFDVFNEGMLQQAPALSDEQRGKRLCDAIVLIGSIGRGFPEVSPETLQEFEAVLASADKKDLHSAKLNAFISTLAWLRTVTPKLEENATRLIQEYPASPGGSLLAQYLSRVRCADPAAKDLVLAQAIRSDLAAKTWLNYAHAALGFGVREDQRKTLRDLHDDVYRYSLENWAERDGRVRLSARMVNGLLFPEQFKDFGPQTEKSDRYMHSNSERRTMGVLRSHFGDKVSVGRFIPEAPSIDGDMKVPDYSGKELVIFFDGQIFHSVNEGAEGGWFLRGFDGHTCLVTSFFRGVGYPVLRISEQMGNSGNEGPLCDAVSAARDYLVTGCNSAPDYLVVDPSYDFTHIAGRVILYTPLDHHRPCS